MLSIDNESVNNEENTDLQSMMLENVNNSTDYGYEPDQTTNTQHNITGVPDYGNMNEGRKIKKSADRSEWKRKKKAMNVR